MPTQIAKPENAERYGELSIAMTNAARTALETDEINRRISEAREPKPTWTHGTLTNGAAWEITNPLKDDLGINPRDWTGSEEASAVLLEEMPEPLLFLMVDARQWWCDPDSRQETTAESPDRKVAIALAWLKWKGLDA